MKTTASMFASNAVAVTILTKEAKRRLWMVSYEHRNERKNRLQPRMVGQVVKEKPKEKGKAIFQES